MFSRAQSRNVAIAATLLTGTALVPATSTFAQPAPAPSVVQAAGGQVRAAQAAATPSPSASAAAARPAPAPAASITPNAQPGVSFRSVVSRANTVPVSRASTEVDSELECLAKVVLHEAGNQSRAGQLAVAHVVMNRVRSGRFASTICGTVMQRGQFFNVHAYNGQRDPRWRTAVSVAREVRDEGAQSNVGGALFFRASYGRGFPGRTRIVQIGDHVFYR